MNPTHHAQKNSPGTYQDDVVIRVRDLCKFFKLYNAPVDRLKESMHPLRKQYHQKFHALKNVSFDIRRGETVGIVGRNGSGKSTLLKIITGVLTPSSGTCEVNGRVSAILELGSGFNPELSGLENVYFSGMLMGYSKQEMDNLLDPILEFADIGTFIHQPVKTYSSGMMVRLAFSVQTMVDAQILIVDEALAVGDEAFQRKCFARLEKLRQQGCTLLYVSHTAPTVIALCNHAMLLHKGELLLQGSPKFVVTRYQRIAHAPTEELEQLVASLKAEGGRDLESDENKAPEENNVAVDAPVEEPAATPAAGEVGDAPSVAPDNDAEYGQARFDPYLLPKSTVNYAPQGAEIMDVHIITPQGNMVNILQRGHTYIYRYRVRFETECENVRFAMLLKNNQGFPLGGCLSHPKTQGLECLRQGEIYNVRFSFRCLLAAGTYFCNAGVEGQAGGKTPTYLHRIMDAAMFRVEEAPGTTLTATVDFSFKAACAPQA